LAVQTGVFPLYEIENGKYKITVEPSPIRPVQDYFKLQGRFRHLSEGNIKDIQERVIKDYEALKEKSR
jgi:pyruvate ferredoxin oxidoreductase beta subunit